MAKTKKQLLQELLDLESDSPGDLGNAMVSETKPSVNISLPDDALDKTDDEEKIVAPKKKKELTAKQIEALKKGQQIRDENARKRIEERTRKEEEDKKIMEEKLVKKAIAIKRKELKRQEMLDELSDDETMGTKVPINPPSSKGITADKKIDKVIEPPKPVAPYAFSFF